MSKTYECVQKPEKKNLSGFTYPKLNTSEQGISKYWINLQSSEVLWIGWIVNIDDSRYF
jgi:hypothetical protein